VLGWEPKVSFRDLARMMTDTDMQMARKEAILKEHGE
jgi:GDP-D-mannose dehydratase